MKLLTPDGFTDARRRSSPLAGLDMSRRLAQSWIGDVSLVDLGGQRYTATFYDIYRSNPWAFAAVNLIASTVSRFPLRTYRIMDEEGNRERVRGDINITPGRMTAGQNLDRVLHQPEPRVSKTRVIRKSLTDMLVYGNALSTIDRGPAGIKYLWHAPWRRVTVVTGEQVPVLFYEVAGAFGGTVAAGGANKFIPEDTVHFSIGNDPDSPLGLAPLASCQNTLALYNAMFRHITAYFANSARPSGNLRVDKGNRKEILDFIREQVTAMYASPENAGKILVTTGEWQSLTDTPDHTSIVELIKLSREEIAAAYGVPPPMLGILDRAIMGNVKELRSHLTRDVSGAWAVMYEDELNAQLLEDSPALAGHFVEFALDENLRPDIEALAVALRNLQNTLTLNERRKIMNAKPIENTDADAVFLDLNQGPVGDDTEPRPPVAPPGGIGPQSP